MKYIIALLITTFVLSGCHTIHFTNGEPQRPSNGISGSGFDYWHHVGILNLVEYSAPVDLARKCPDTEWDYVTVQKGVVQIVADVAVGWIGGGLFWSPWDAYVECR